MRIGIPTEIKNNENRVAATPGGVHELVRRGHEVVVQAGAGLGSGITTRTIAAAGATHRRRRGRRLGARPTSSSR